MPLRLLAHVTGLLGGLAWVARWQLGDGAAADAAYWAGLVLLAVSLAAYGAGLVTAAWLRVVAGVALPVLVWSVVVVLRGDGGVVVDAVIGLGLLLVSLLGLVRARRSRTARQSRRSSRSSRSSSTRRSRPVAGAHAR